MHEKTNTTHGFFQKKKKTRHIDTIKRYLIFIILFMVSNDYPLKRYLPIYKYWKLGNDQTIFYLLHPKERKHDCSSQGCLYYEHMSFPASRCSPSWYRYIFFIQSNFIHYFLYYFIHNLSSLLLTLINLWFTL